MRKVVTRITGYQRVDVWKSGGEVEFRVAGAIHAWFHRQRLLTGQAWDLIGASALLGPGGRPRSVLMLGLAGGTSFRLLRELLPECELTAVEIDIGIVELAREHMELDQIGVEIVISNAYEWLRQNRRKFDVVIDDIYLAGSEDVFRPVETDSSVLRWMKNAIAPGGVFAMNLVTGVGHRMVQIRNRALMKAEFSVVRTLQTPDAQNEVLVGGDRVLPSGTLSRYASCFRSARDRTYWQRITDRKLR